jgi:hypothetical protein
MFHREAPTEMVIMNEALRSKLRSIKNHSSLFSKIVTPEHFNRGSSQDIPYWIPAKNMRE